MDRGNAGEGNYRLRLEAAKAVVAVASGGEMPGTGRRVGEGAISQHTPITMGLVLLVVGLLFGAIFKAGQVLTEFEYVKASVNEIKTEMTEIKRLLRDSGSEKRSDYNEQDAGDHSSLNVGSASPVPPTRVNKKETPAG